jgi:RND family efflux transporter MFP subunit
MAGRIAAAAFFALVMIVSLSENSVAQSAETGGGSAAAADSQGFIGPQARALVTARDRAVLSAELEARIAEMPVRPGEAFAEGDTLVRFACDRHAAQRDTASADVASARARLDSVEKMVSLNAAGPLEAAIARAELERAEAQLRLFQADVNRCRLRAPYDGRVVAWHSNPHEMARVGIEAVEIVAAGDLELEMIVPSAWLAWLEDGQALSLSVDETGEAYGATVTSIGAEVDPVSQTVPVRATFDSPPEDLIPGMSGVAVFPAPDRS